jgi:protein TonB
VIALTTEDRSDLLRWLICGALVISAHAIAATLIAWHEPIEEVGEVGTDAIIVEFQPELIPAEPVPEPIEKIEEKPEPLPERQSEAMLPQEQKPEPAPPKEQIPVLIQQQQRAVTSVATWKSQLITILEHNKRYPADAHVRGEQGLALIQFSIDRDGHLLSSRLVKSSGYAALDAEAMSLVRRAEPYPPPPPDSIGQELTFSYRFKLN